MRNIRIIFSYDGSRFFGSQSQSGGRTVQDGLELAIFKLTGERSKVNFAGRTDSGVSAFSQTANFLTDSRIPADRFPQALNSKLDKGIRVKSACDVNRTFDPRRQAKKREYLYYVFNGKHLPILFWGRALHVTRPLDVKKMAKAAKLFLGEHDFVSFCGKGDAQKSTIRRIYSLDVSKIGADLIKQWEGSGDLICFRIVAGSFLYKMVRFIIATLLEVGYGRMDEPIVRKLLKGKAKDARRTIVPSCGLYLNKVKY